MRGISRLWGSQLSQRPIQLGLLRCNVSLTFQHVHHRVSTNIEHVGTAINMYIYILFRHQRCTTDDECQLPQICDGRMKVCRERSDNSNGWFCSGTPSRLCKEGEGDCDSDGECEGGLVCSQPCPSGRSSFECCLAGQ